MTKVFKNIRGLWQAESNVEHDGRTIQIVTMKRSNGQLCSNVTVGTSDRGFFAYTIFQDYSKTWFRVDQRATEKAVTMLHDNCMAQIELIKKDVDTHYNVM